MNNKIKFKQTEIGLIPEEWGMKSIFDIAILITKGTTPTIISGGFSSSGIRFIKVENLSDDGRILNNKFTYIDESTNASLKRSILKENDILFTIAGTIGRVAIMSKEFLPANTNQAVAFIRPDLNKIDLNFLKYYLLCPFVKKYVLSKVVHAVQANLSLAELGNSLLIYPGLDEQPRIASILSSLDDKIELNRKISANLEQIVSALFKRWFVDFEFPNTEGKPYKSSGGRMVESELGEIPEGWKVEPILNFGRIVCGKTPSKTIKEYFNGDVPFVKIPDMHGNMFILKTEDTLTELGAASQGNKTIPEGSICVSCIATVGLVSIVTDNSQTNQQINSVVPSKPFYKIYLFHVMKNLEGYLQRMGSSGSATLNVNTTDFSLVNIMRPDDKILESFSKLVEPLFNQIKTCSEMSFIVSKVRDSLLPRLMSGRIRVK